MSAPKFKKNKTVQVINLKEEFGIDFSGKDDLKEIIGQAIIDRMIQRTEAGQGMAFNSRGAGREVKLKSPYSKAYQKSAAFKAAGKSKSHVNMTLKGNMLSSIALLEVKGNTIKVGIDDPKEAPKSHNHNLGTTLPKRPFFGISKKELKEIKEEFGEDLQTAIDAKQSGDKKDFDSAVTDLLKRVEDGDNS